MFFVIIEKEVNEDSVFCNYCGNRLKSYRGTTRK